MYQLINNQLQHIEEIVTPNQKAIITTTIYIVPEYNSDVPIMFESIPVKEEKASKISELHFIDGVLVWQYKDKPMTQEEFIKNLEDQLLLMADSTTGGIL